MIKTHSTQFILNLVFKIMVKIVIIENFGNQHKIELPSNFKFNTGSIMKMSSIIKGFIPITLYKYKNTS